MRTAVGLLATSRTKRKEPAPVAEFYQSPLFVKSLQYADQTYQRYYFYNAKDGLVLPGQMMTPYDRSIKTFSSPEKKIWGRNVVRQLLSHENPEEIALYLHGGMIYRKFLEPSLKAHGFEFCVPLKGLAIGKQLKWYEEALSIEE